VKAHQLAKLLLKMPNIEVGYSHMDNSEHEVAGACCDVVLLVKSEIDTTRLDRDGLSMYNSLPERVVVIRG
jgi:hypothetical protein